MILKNNQQPKKNKHTPSGYSLFTQCIFHATKNKVNCYRSKDCMKRFWKDLKECEAKIVTGVTFCAELHARQINVPVHQ